MTPNSLSETLYSSTYELIQSRAKLESVSERIAKNPKYKSLPANGFLKDHGKNDYRSSSMWKPDLVPGLRIDHIFTSPYFEKADFAVESNSGNLDWSGSDHHPVVLRIKE